MHQRVYLPRTIHSDHYYLAVLKTLIHGLNAGFTDRELANTLNASAILSPVGKPWTPNAVKMALRKLRHHRDFPSRLHRALLMLVYDGKLTAPETYILFQKREEQVM